MNYTSLIIYLDIDVTQVFSFALNIMESKKVQILGGSTLPSKRLIYLLIHYSAFSSLKAR